MPNVNPQVRSRIINKVALGGINTFDDPKDIDDVECVDILNMVFDNGTVFPRQGTFLYANKPVDETATPFQMLVATDSNGIDYMIMNYGLNFYLRYSDIWIKLNHTYTPPSASLYYGSTNWNNGIIDDRFYFGNGKDSTIKWVMAITTVTAPTPIGGTFIAVLDNTSFPNSGDIVIQNPDGTFQAGGYSAKGGNSLVITASIPIEIGAVVTMQISDVPDIPKGKILTKFQNRLVLANSVEAENTINYSVLGDPEDYTISTDDTSGGFYVIFKGKGGIINIDNFGEYLVIEKKDIMLSFQFEYASDNTGFIIQVVPIISGESIGPVSNANSLNYMNTLYYTTESEGIVSFSPDTTGSQTSSGLKVLSQKLQNYVTDVLNFKNGRTAGFNQKLFWVNAVPILNGIENTINNGVIMFDLIRQVWTRFDNWNIADIKPVNNVLYQVSLNDGAVYETFVDYQDAVSGNPVAYDVSFTTKRFDFDEPAMLSRGQYVYLQGYISETTNFFIDVLFNENGVLGKQTFEIDGTNGDIVQNNISGGLSEFPFGIPLLGGFNLRTMQQLQQPAFFRAYLQISQDFRPNNIQIKCYSQSIGAYWGVNNITLMTLSEPSVPTQMVIGPSANPPVIL